jgi:hypothetical protein
LRGGLGLRVRGRRALRCLGGYGGLVLVAVSSSTSVFNPHQLGHDTYHMDLLNGA